MSSVAFMPCAESMMFDYMGQIPSVLLLGKIIDLENLSEHAYAHSVPILVCVFCD